MGCARAALFGLVVLALVVVMMAVAPPWRPSSTSPVPLDLNAWKANVFTDDEPWPRLRMLDDLIARNLIVGRARADVVALLGPPDDEYWSPTYPFPGWDVGVPPGWEDSTGVMVEFNEDGLATKVYAPVIGLNTREGWTPPDAREPRSPRNAVRLEK